MQLQTQSLVICWVWEFYLCLQANSMASWMNGKKKTCVHRDKGLHSQGCDFFPFICFGNLWRTCVLLGIAKAIERQTWVLTQSSILTLKCSGFLLDIGFGDNPFRCSYCPSWSQLLKKDICTGDVRLQTHAFQWSLSNKQSNWVFIFRLAIKSIWPIDRFDTILTFVISVWLDL